MNALAQLLPFIHIPELIIALAFSGCGILMSAVAVVKAGKVSKAYNKGIIITVFLCALFYYLAFSV